VERVPFGVVKVTIASRKVRLPAKFAEPETSGLNAEVKKGKVVIDFRLSN
jgi:hypothetical protein